MGPVAGVVGVAVIGVALWDTFETVVLPRRVTRRLRPARLLFKSLWKLWLLVAAVIRRPSRRESFLSLFGPFSLIALLGGWASMLLLGFALVHSALGLQMSVPERQPTFFTALYLSGTTLFTLGLGDVVPTSAAAQVVTGVEAFVGVAVLAGLDGVRPRQAWLTFAMARHVAVDLCQVLDTPPHPPDRDRLPPDDLRRLRAVLNEAGVVLRTGDEVDRKLSELRRSYEPYV